MRAVLRWWAEKVGKQNVVPRSNDAYGIPKRAYVTNESKAKPLDGGQLAAIRDECVPTSLRLVAPGGAKYSDHLKHFRYECEQGSKTSPGTICAIPGRAGTCRTARPCTTCRRWVPGSPSRWFVVTRIARWRSSRSTRR